jgi:predicted transposase YbfD/YdcC
MSVSMEEVLQQFSTLEDPRSTINRHHPLPSVIVIAIMAILAEAKGPTGIAKWAAKKAEFLEQWLPLPHGVPAKDVFRRVLMALQPAAFQACFVSWLNLLRQRAAERTGIERPTFAIDGKTLRRSHDRRHNLGALHSVSVWASEFGLTLAQVATDEKSNEITAIPLALSLVDVKGAIITIDAMGTQTAIAQKIIDGGGDYLLALKGNQETLFTSAVEYLEQQAESDFADCGAQQHVTREKGHGRQETRTYIQVPVPPDLAGTERWPQLLTLGMAILCSIKQGVETVDVRYYISSLTMNVKQFAHSARSHWGIENTCHWCLDVTYREDESRLREEHARENFAWLRRFTLSLLKQHPSKGSVAMRRQECAWDEHFLLQVLTGTAS